MVVFVCLMFWDIVKFCVYFILCMIVSVVGVIGIGFVVFVLSVN